MVRLVNISIVHRQYLYRLVKFWQYRGCCFFSLRFWKAAAIPICEGRHAFPINTIKVHEYNGEKSTAGRMLRAVGGNLSDANNVLRRIVWGLDREEFFGCLEIYFQLPVQLTVMSILADWGATGATNISEEMGQWRRQNKQHQTAFLPLHFRESWVLGAGLSIRSGHTIF